MDKRNKPRQVGGYADDVGRTVGFQSRTSQWTERKLGVSYPSYRTSHWSEGRAGGGFYTSKPSLWPENRARYAQPNVNVPPPALPQVATRDLPPVLFNELRSMNDAALLAAVEKIEKLNQLVVTADQRLQALLQQAQNSDPGLRGQAAAMAREKQRALEEVLMASRKQIDKFKGVISESLVTELRPKVSPDLFRRLCLYYGVVVPDEEKPKEQSVAPPLVLDEIAKLNDTSIVDLAQKVELWNQRLILHQQKLEADARCQQLGIIPDSIRLNPQAGGVRSLADKAIEETLLNQRVLENMQLVDKLKSEIVEFMKELSSKLPSEVFGRMCKHYNFIDPNANVAQPEETAPPSGSDAQPSDAQPSDPQPSDTQPLDAQPSDTQPLSTILDEIKALGKVSIYSLAQNVDAWSQKLKSEKIKLHTDVSCQQQGMIPQSLRLNLNRSQGPTRDDHNLEFLLLQNRILEGTQLVDRLKAEMDEFMSELSRQLPEDIFNRFRKHYSELEQTRPPDNVQKEEPPSILDEIKNLGDGAILEILHELDIRCQRLAAAKDTLQSYVQCQQQGIIPQHLRLQPQANIGFQLSNDRAIEEGLLQHHMFETQKAIGSLEVEIEEFLAMLRQKLPSPDMYEKIRKHYGVEEPSERPGSMIVEVLFEELRMLGNPLVLEIAQTIDQCDKNLYAQKRKYQADLQCQQSGVIPNYLQEQQFNRQGRRLFGADLEAFHKNLLGRQVEEGQQIIDGLCREMQIMMSQLRHLVPPHLFERICKHYEVVVPDRATASLEPTPHPIFDEVRQKGGARLLEVARKVELWNRRLLCHQHILQLDSKAKQVGAIPRSLRLHPENSSKSLTEEKAKEWRMLNLRMEENRQIVDRLKVEVDECFAILNQKLRMGLFNRLRRHFNKETEAGKKLLKNTREDNIDEVLKVLTKIEDAAPPSSNKAKSQVPTSTTPSSEKAATSQVQKPTPPSTQKAATPQVQKPTPSSSQKAATQQVQKSAPPSSQKAATPQVQKPPQVKHGLSTTAEGSAKSLPAGPSPGVQKPSPPKAKQPCVFDEIKLLEDPEVVTIAEVVEKLVAEIAALKKEGEQTSLKWYEKLNNQNKISKLKAEIDKGVALLAEKLPQEVIERVSQQCNLEEPSSQTANKEATQTEESASNKKGQVDNASAQNKTGSSGEVKTTKQPPVQSPSKPPSQSPSKPSSQPPPKTSSQPPPKTSSQPPPKTSSQPSPKPSSQPPSKAPVETDIMKTIESVGDAEALRVAGNVQKVNQKRMELKDRLRQCELQVQNNAKGGKVAVEGTLQAQIKKTREQIDRLGQIISQCVTLLSRKLPEDVLLRFCKLHDAVEYIKKTTEPKDSASGIKNDAKSKNGQQESKTDAPKSDSNKSQQATATKTNKPASGTNSKETPRSTDTKQKPVSEANKPSGVTNDAKRRSSSESSKTNAGSRAAQVPKSSDQSKSKPSVGARDNADEARRANSPKRKPAPEASKPKATPQTSQKPKAGKQPQPKKPAPATKRSGTAASLFRTPDQDEVPAKRRYSPSPDARRNGRLDPSYSISRSQLEPDRMYAEESLSRPRPSSPLGRRYDEDEYERRAREYYSSSRLRGEHIAGADPYPSTRDDYYGSSSRDYLTSSSSMYPERRTDSSSSSYLTGLLRTLEDLKTLENSQKFAYY